MKEENPTTRFRGGALVSIIIIIFIIIVIIKVGTEWVIKGQTCEQSTNATAGIARAIYDRLFKFLIEVRIVISNLFSTTASSRK